MTSTSFVTSKSDSSGKRKCRAALPYKTSSIGSLRKPSKVDKILRGFPFKLYKAKKKLHET